MTTINELDDIEIMAVSLEVLAESREKAITERDDLRALLAAARDSLRLLVAHLDTPALEILDMFEGQNIFQLERMLKEAVKGARESLARIDAKLAKGEQDGE